MQPIRTLFIALCLTALCSASAIAAQEGSALCAETGGSWTECGSGCGPVSCANPPTDSSEPVMCPTVCVSLCKCPAMSPYWDDSVGCHDGALCTQTCDADESWDAELQACCPDAVYATDCMCEEGSSPQETTDYDDNGCLLGYGCECVPAGGGTCDEGDSWDADLEACCPDAIYTADCWCEDGTYPQETTDYNESGCLLGYGCECLPDAGGTCDEGDSWDADLSVCCPNATYAQMCECGPGTYAQETTDYDESGCLLGYGCECLPDAGGTCDEGDSWDVDLQACCPDAVYVSDCVCGDGLTYQEKLDYDDNGCLLGYGCECLPSDENPLTDNDGDGYTSDVDCDDTENGIHPGAVEVCNGVDDDCDAEVDEGACETNPGQCDDDFDALCDMEPPTCDEGLLLAVQQGCYVCVDPTTCKPPEAPDVALCDATGGAWNMCGCPAITCENPPPGPDEEDLPCPPSCWEVCECPENAPIWDDTAGCVALATCEDEPAADGDLCADTGGFFNECGSDCDLFTCETPPSGGPYPCSAAAVCFALCECPEEAPVWDAEQGCIAEEACGGSPEDPVAALCADTGGVMDECLSACPADPCADEPAESVDCVAVCIIGCACPAEAPYWDATAGCQADPNCPEGTEGPDDGGEPADPGPPSDDATCEDGDSWDIALEACCPDAVFVAVCGCDDGSVPQTTDEHDANGCLVGNACTCDGDASDDSGGCAGGGDPTSLLWMLGLSVLALSLRRRTLTVQSVH
jgi:hypothetical protein